MTKLLAAVELDRRLPDHHEPQRSRDERDRLTRQLRAASEKAAKSWDDGFAACVDMVRRGASLDQLYAKLRGHPAEIPQVARVTTREFGPDETTRVAIPLELWESEEKTEPMVLIPFAPESKEAL